MATTTAPAKTTGPIRPRDSHEEPLAGYGVKQFKQLF